MNGSIEGCQTHTRQTQLRKLNYKEIVYEGILKQKIGAKGQGINGHEVLKCLKFLPAASKAYFAT